MTDNPMRVLLDEAEIRHLLNRYANVLDQRDYAALDDIFTATATTHYHGIGQFVGIEEIRSLMVKVLEQCGPTQHLLGTVTIEVEGDAAQARCYLQAIHVGRGDRASDLYTVWGEYRDRLQRTDGGWRIVHRELAGIHSEGDIGLQMEIN